MFLRQRDCSVHNCRHFIAEALDSIAKQDFAVAEIIVIDDSSNDQTAEFVESNYPEAKLLRTDVANAASTRNLGVQHASHPWIAFLDADDMWFPNHVSDLRAALQSGDVAALSLHQSFRDGSNSLNLGEDASRPATAGGLTHEDFMHRLTQTTSGWPTSGMMINRARFNEVGGFDVTQVRRHDLELFSRVVHQHHWAMITKPTWRYRVRSEGNLSGNKPEVCYYSMVAHRKIHDLYGGKVAKLVLQRRAKIAAGAAVRSGDVDLCRRVITDAADHLPLTWRLTSPLWVRAPKLAGVLLR